MAPWLRERCTAICMTCARVLFQARIEGIPLCLIISWIIVHSDVWSIYSIRDTVYHHESTHWWVTSPIHTSTSYQKAPIWILTVHVVAVFMAIKENEVFIFAARHAFRYVINVWYCHAVHTTEIVLVPMANDDGSVHSGRVRHPITTRTLR